MLSAKDIEKIITAQKEIFYNKEDLDEKFEEQTASFSKLQTAVDGFAKTTKDAEQETMVFGHRVGRVEEWAKRAGDKIDL